MKLKIIALFFVTGFKVAAQTPQVPHKIHFANMTLTIRDDARREIQKDVDALTQSPRHFNIKVERARTYFPEIEKIFKEENLPDDFKYLALQESALIPDAVSVSNAVGFWQFKDFTAMEMGLRVDKEIDERMNISSSTRAAARYLKKNNHFFNNWLYALQAYQMGAGGVMKAVKDTEGGTKHMEINSSTYWYVKKYLAHKIAFEDVVKGAGQLELVMMENKKKKTLSDIAKEVTVNEEELKSFNKWVRSGVIPDDRVYSIAVPVKGSMQLLNMPVASANTSRVSVKNSTGSAVNNRDEKIKVNGITAMKARAGENATAFAARAGMDVSFFLKCNDLSIHDKLKEGGYYYVSKKRARARDAYHTVNRGEKLWDISQQYGIRLKKLKRYNRVTSDNEIREGMTLWLSAVKPKDSEAPLNLDVSEDIVELDGDEAFSWQIEAVPEQQKEVPVAAINTHLTENSDTEGPAGAGSQLSVQPPVSAANNRVEDGTADIVLPEQHVVEAGETLYGIGKKYDLEVMDLIAWNGLNIQDGIKPGQILKLQQKINAAEPEARTGPVQMEAEAVEITHEVRPTDTLYSIARKYGVTIKDLMDLNEKKDFALTVGEKLRIRQK